MFEKEFSSQIKKDEEFYKKEIILLRDIQWVRDCAEKIDKENNNILKKLKNLEMENFIEESEKKFLIEKIIKENEKYFFLENIIYNYNKNFQKSKKPSIMFFSKNRDLKKNIIFSYQNLVSQNYFEKDYIEILGKLKKKISDEIFLTKNLKKNLLIILDSKEKLKAFFKKLIHVIQFKINSFQDENFLKKKIFCDQKKVNLFDHIFDLMQKEKFLLFIYDHIFLINEIEN